MLHLLVTKAAYLSETERDATLELLRGVEADFGVSGVVPPAPGAMNAPPPAPVVDPGPVAEPVPPAEQVPPVTSPEVAVADPEATNAFSGTDPSAAP